MQQYNTTERNQVMIRNDLKKVTAKSAANDERQKVLKTVTPIVDDSVEYQTPQTLAKRTKAIEIPMETRLENLSLGTGDKQLGKNVVQLLIQGLHNRDAT